MKNKLKERIKENYKKNKYVLFVFVLLFIGVSVFSINHYHATLGMQSVGNESYDRAVTEINKEVSVSYEVETVDDAESVSILFATYARRNSGNVEIEIRGVNSKTLYAYEFVPTSSILDNSYYTLELSEKLRSYKDHKLLITVTSDSEVGQGVGIYSSNVRWFEHSKLTIGNNLLEESDLCIKYLVQDESLKAFSNTVIYLSFVALMLLGLMIILIDPKKEVLYAVLIFVMGLIIMAIIVPASPPDELSHYEVTLKLSNMMMFKERDFIDSIYMKYGYMYGHFNISPGYIRLINELNGPLKMTGKIIEIERNTDITYWVGYIPNTLGILLGRFLKLNMITTLYCARLFGLMFYTACVYYSIKIIPTFKNILGYIALMPMFVQTAMAISPDVFILSMTFISIAYFVKWFFEDKKILLKDVIIVIAVSALLAPAKVLYSFFAYTFWFVPVTRFKDLKTKILICILICATGTYQLFGIMIGPIQLLLHKVLYSESYTHTLFVEDAADTLSTITHSLRAPGIYGGPYKEVYTFSYIFSHPMEVIAIFARTIRYKIKFWFYGSICRTLSGDSLVLPIRMIQIIIASVFAMSFVKQDYTYPFLIKFLSVLMCIVVGLYALIGMFVSWTDSAQEIIPDFGGILIEGIQGRYFSPLLPYMFAIFPNKKISLPKKSESYILLFYLFMFFEIILYVLSYTFVN